MTPELRALGDEAYVSLATYRKSGAEVRTPVWIAPDGERLLVYTNRTSGKVKRIRAGARVSLAACDVRGGVRGDFVEAHARMLDESERDAALDAVVRKYGWQMRVALLTSRLSGRFADRAAIEITDARPAGDER